MPLWFDGLLEHLTDQSADCVALTVSDIERLVGQPLPRSAYQRQYWRFPGVNGWQRRRLAAIGWRVSGFDRLTGTVSFARTAELS